MRVLPLAALALLAAAPHGTSAEPCAALAGVRIAPARIGLPTRGAVVLSARPMPAYCEVRAVIRAVDRTAPDIRFELDLPGRWNGKALMEGGGGFDGAVPDTAGPFPGQPPSAAPTPLTRGYAVFGGDSGHRAHNPTLPTPAVDGAFAINDEALANYAGDALKKTRDAAVALIARRYGRAPSRSYFVGGSNGGREGFVVAQRWPADFDGVIAISPFLAAGTNALVFGDLYRAWAAPGAYLGPDKRALVERAATDACDGLDGLADGLVANVEACAFNPASLRCLGGADDGKACLSDAQVALLRRYAGPFRFGGRTYPGFTVLAGADIANVAQLGTTPPASPPVAGMPLAALYWDQLARFAIARDPAFDPTTFDPENPGRFARRINRLVDMLDVRPAGLSQFRRRGGKLLVWHGLADPLVSHRATEAYWAALEAAMGKKAVASFARFFVAPGFGHGGGVFVPVWDPLTALEAWAENGVAPDGLTVSDGAGRTRPLCEHGTWPRYLGHGDENRAASFTCQSSSAG